MTGHRPRGGHAIVVGTSVATVALSSLCYFGPGTPAARPWNAAPLFTYAALLGFLLPGIVELGRVRGRLAAPAQGVRWMQVHVGLVVFAAVNTVGVYLTGEDTAAGIPVAIVGSAAILWGARMTERLQ